MTTALLWLAAGALVAGGLAGLVLPALPGAPLVFAGLFLAAWIDGFRYVGIGTLAVLAILAGLTWAADFAAGALGARGFGASGRAIAGAVAGGVIGLFFGLPGLLLGPFAGAVLGELSLRRGLGQAGRAGIGATVGLAVGLAAKVALSCSMVALFLVVRFLWH